MKDGFKSITIEPFDGHLDFHGPINAQKPYNNSKVLKGDIRLELTKAIKVKRATIKFKGLSRISYRNTLDIVNITTPLLPKLKLPLLSSTTTLGPGEVILPWEMEIHNIYPASVMIKRACIQYKVELIISLGLNRTVKAEYPVVIKRHLLPCMEMAPLVPTKLYTKTISTKFHYEIEAPRIVCVAQESIPMAIKLLAIGNQKRVLSIRTQLIQVELYRFNALLKSDADMTKFKSQLSGKKNSTSTSTKKGETNKYAKYTKRTTPVIIHTLDETQPLSSSQPLLIRHPLGKYLTLGLESPLAAIYHQLEIVFQFGAKFEDIRAKVPILVASAGPSTPPSSNANDSIPLALYPYEKLPVMEPLLVTEENRSDGGHSISIRIPTPTPSTDTNEDEDVNVILEIMASQSPTTTNDSIKTGFQLSPPKHQRPLRNKNKMDMISGMWPRPETQVPHQWRRRSSPPSVSTTETPQPPQRPRKDARRKWAPPIQLSPPPQLLLQRQPLPPPRHRHISPPEEEEEEVDSLEDESETSSSCLTTTTTTDYEPQSRPHSPSFAPAPGLPPFISLRPQDATPLALLEESFVLSPVSSHYQFADMPSHQDSLEYTQDFTRGSSSDRRSIVSTTQSSILDPDEIMIERMQAMGIQYRQQQQQQQQSPQALEQHYAYAELPPIPLDDERQQPPAFYYAESDDDDDDDDDDTTGMYDDDDDDDTTGTYDDSPVCLCPKHGVVIPRRL